mmetsp:Transcript_14788/g.30603  ORF Transcript_14788/g.30603 Transcript_14788/m.30603 type:complete len:97 (-) Transcript_14788:1191-1481(-)
MPSDDKLAPPGPNAAAPSDGKAILSSRYWSKLFIVKPWRTPIDGARFAPTPYWESAGAPGLPPAPKPRCAASFNKVLGPGNPPKPREFIAAGGRAV